MGFSLSWLAVKGKPPQEVREVLGFRPTGKRESIPEAPISAVEMPSGWYLIVCQHTECVASDALLQNLSAGCELVTGFVEEHVMACSATGWKDGKKLWAVTHDSQIDRQHLEVIGEPPQQFAEIRTHFVAKDKEEVEGENICDYLFEIPVEIAHAVTGYRHDYRIPELDGDVFEVLKGRVPADEKKRSWFQKIFGR